MRLTAEQQALVADNLALVNWFVTRNEPSLFGDRRDELFQELSASLCRMAYFFDPGKGIAFSTYVVRSLWRALKLWRCEQAQRRVFVSLEKGVDVARTQHPDGMELFELCRRWLPARWYGVVRMRFIDGMSRSEIGRLIGITPQRVDQIEKRALELVQDCLRKEDRA